MVALSASRRRLVEDPVVGRPGLVVAAVGLLGDGLGVLVPVPLQVGADFPSLGVERVPGPGVPRGHAVGNRGAHVGGVGVAAAGVDQEPGSLGRAHPSRGQHVQDRVGVPHRVVRGPRPLGLQREVPDPGLGVRVHHVEPVRRHPGQDAAPRRSLAYRLVRAGFAGAVARDPDRVAAAPELVVQVATQRDLTFATQPAALAVVRGERVVEGAGPDGGLAEDHDRRGPGQEQVVLVEGLRRLDAVVGWDRIEQLVIETEAAVDLCRLARPGSSTGSLRPRRSGRRCSRRRTRSGSRTPGTGPLAGAAS